MNILEISLRLADLSAERREADDADDSDRLNQICDETVALQDRALSLPPANVAEAVLQIGIARACIDDARGSGPGTDSTLEQLDQALALLSKLLLS